MEKQRWIADIRDACRAAGTYKPFFEPVIDTLAGILEKRDETERLYWESGGQPVISHVNQAKAANPVKNPYLVLLGELNAQALAYWRDLGLTPAGLKKIDEAALKEKKKSALAAALADLEGQTKAKKPAAKSKAKKR